MRKEGPAWRIVYDDGDDEELYEDQVRDILLDDDPGKAPPPSAIASPRVPQASDAQAQQSLGHQRRRNSRTRAQKRRQADKVDGTPASQKGDVRHRRISPLARVEPGRFPQASCNCSPAFGPVVGVVAANQVNLICNSMARALPFVRDSIRGEVNQFPTIQECRNVFWNRGLGVPRHVDCPSGASGSRTCVMRQIHGTRVRSIPRD